MSDNECNVFYARNLNELFYNLKTIANLQILGGCTSIKKMPPKSISTINIPEMKGISKHERFLEIRPGTTLSEILSIGERHIPHILVDSINSVGNLLIRNMATIGGNIMQKGIKHTLYAPLLALDTTMEFKSPSETHYIPMLNFSEIPAGSVLTNFRIPLNDWDIQYFGRLGPEKQISENSASFAFLVDTEKGIINNLKIAFAGTVAFRVQELENKMLGLRLPLSKKNIPSLVFDASVKFDQATQNIEYPPVLRQQFLNLVRYSFDQLT